MRMSASGEQSMIAVAIDQILRLAPSISGPIEPVVSSTKATSTIGFGLIRAEGSSAEAKAVVAANAAAKQAGTSARSTLEIIGHPPENFPTRIGFPGFAT